MNKLAGELDKATGSQNHTILIIDDEPDNLAVVADYLAQSGFQIRVTQTGEAGLELARRTPPDLILLDVRLPGVDGFEVCRRLKADEHTRQIPVIFMTVLTRMEDKLKGFEAGGVDYISKPFQKEEVLARVVTHLRLRDLTQALEAANKGLELRVAERTSELVHANARLKEEIAERKQAEEQIRNMNQELEQRVLERTDELNNTNKELETFAYSVSHDLRSPLRHIGGFLELLRARVTPVLDEESLHYMDIIADSHNRMGMMIDDLLSFSRMGRNGMSKSQIDLGELVQDVIHEFRPETEGRDIQWNISPLPVVTGDRAMLRMVLVNLISNALKYTRPRPQARIEIGWLPGCETETIVFVCDNGVGFDMKYADNLFGVFQRLHRADEFEGTGIGLANVHRIINRHGGKTWAKGEVGQGATFYFSLPQPNQTA